MKPSRTLLALSTLSIAMADQAPCTLRHCGTFVDLNPLAAEKDYIFQSYTGRNFTLNVCKSVTSEAWNPRVDDTKNIGGFTRGAHGDISLGETNSTLHSRDAQPVIVMTNGSPCEKDAEKRASSVIRFVCDKSVDIGMPHLVAQLPEEDEDACTFFIEWRTRHACSRKEGNNTTLIILGLALTFLSLLGLLFFIYTRLFRHNQSPSLPGTHSDTGVRAHFRDFARFILRRDPWGDPDEHLGLPNGTTATGNGHAFIPPSSSKSWLPWRWRLGRSSNPSRAGFSRLARSPEEEAGMMDDESDEEEERRVGANGGAGYEENNLNSSAVWGESRPRGMDSSGVIRL